MAGTRFLPPPPVGNDPKSPAYRDWFYKIQQSLGTLSFVDGVSAGTQVQTSGTAVFSNSNNISFGMSNSSVITASYNFNISAGSTSNNRNNVTFANSNGVTFGLNAGTITASVNNSSAPGTGFTSTSTGGSNIVGTLNSSGLSLGIPNYLTTAMVSDAGSRFVNTSAGLNLTNISATFNSNSISLSVGNYITTARASTDGIGLNTAQTNVTWTVNSSGLSLNAGGYAGTGVTTTSTNGTDLKITNNTAGLSIGVPAYITVGGGGGAVTFSAGTSSGALASVVFSNSNNINFGLNGSTITAQAVSLKVYEPVVVTGFNLNVSYTGAEPLVPNFVANTAGDIIMAWGGDYAA